MVQFKIHIPHLSEAIFMSVLIDEGPVPGGACPTLESDALTASCSWIVRLWPAGFTLDMELWSGRQPALTVLAP